MKINMKKLLLVLILLFLSACAQTWYKDGGTQTEFNADEAYCKTVAYSYAPPRLSQVQVGNGYRTPVTTNCNGSVQASPDGYGGAYGTTTNNCVTTGGEYVPPAKITVDNNEDARKAAYISCLYSKGWTTVKPARAGDARQNEQVTSKQDRQNKSADISEEKSNKFSSGDVVLDCKLSCGFADGYNRKKVVEFFDNQRWGELAELIIKINSPRDLNYFYLGKAAEEMGYKEAAIIYYKKAIEQSKTSKRCGYVFKYQCNGIEVPEESERALRRLQ